MKHLPMAAEAPRPGHGKPQQASSATRGKQPARCWGLHPRSVGYHVERSGSGLKHALYRLRAWARVQVPHSASAREESRGAQLPHRLSRSRR